MRAGTPVRLRDLVARPELNTRRGIVISTIKSSDGGRVAVQLEGPRSAQQHSKECVLVRPANLIDLAAEAMAAVLCELDLMLLIFTFIERWARAGNLSGVSSEWRSRIWSHPDLYRSIVVLAPGAFQQQPIAPWDRHSDSHGRSPPLCASKFMLEGALPMLPKQPPMLPKHPCCLTEIPNLAWVEQLFVPPIELNESDVALPHVLKFNFPKLTTLMLYGFGWALAHGVRAGQACRTWLTSHFEQSTLRHVYFDDARHTMHMWMDLLMPTQPGLHSLQLPVNALQIVRGWSSGVRSKLTALDLGGGFDGGSNIQELKDIIQLLPNLRRLGCEAEPGWPDYNGALMFGLAPVIKASNIEALYLTLSEFDLPTWAFDGFEGCWGGKLKELVVSCVAGRLHFFYPDESGEARDMGPATASDAMHFLERSLPQATILIETFDLDDPLTIPDPLHRVLLPATREAWHLAPGTRGLKNLSL